MEQRLRAHRDSLRAGAEGGGGGGRNGDAAANEHASSTVPTLGLEAQSSTSQISLSRASLTQSRPPEIDNTEDHQYVAQ